jgi:pimeloyl-ACP methyl ester carboxylesterase
LQRIYCLSGLGADERIFSRINFHNNNVTFIRWIAPVKGESIQHYAERLSTQVTDPEPVLIGLSFGGMMCIEISRVIKVKAIILISTVKNYHQLPWWMIIAGTLNLHKLVRLQSYSWLAPLQNYTLGVESKEELTLVKEYRRNIDRHYLNWAVNAILKWRSTKLYCDTYHIHGGRDRIFPLQKVKPDIIVPTGGHLMIFNRSEEVNSGILQLLQAFERT